MENKNKTSKFCTWRPKLKYTNNNKKQDDDIWICAYQHLIQSIINLILSY